MKTVTFRHSPLSQQLPERDAAVAAACMEFDQKQQQAAELGLTELAVCLRARRAALDAAQQLHQRPLSPDDMQAVRYCLLDRVRARHGGRILLTQRGDERMLHLVLPNHTVMRVRQTPLAGVGRTLWREQLGTITLDALEAIRDFRTCCPEAEFWVLYPTRDAREDPVVVARLGDESWFVCAWGESVETLDQMRQRYAVWSEGRTGSALRRGWRETARRLRALGAAR